MRVPSLTSVANRYIALSPGPNNRPALPAGATLPTSATQGVVDLDQLFNTFNPRRCRALQEVLQGSAEQYVGTNPDFGLSVKYFAPALRGGLAPLRRAHPGSEDVHGLRRRIGQGADDDRRPRGTARGTRRAREQNLPGGRLAAGEPDRGGCTSCRSRCRAGNRAFAEEPATLKALAQLVEISKPNTKELPLFFDRWTRC